MRQAPERPTTMLVTTKAIVLKTFEHGDNTLVLKAWTERSGLRTYLVRTGKGKGRSKAVLQPLNRVELVALENPEREMHPVREIRVARPYMRLLTDPLRGSVALFVQEVLYKVLRQESADQALDTFIHEALEALDNTSDLRHYPLVFLIRLSEHLGFMPEPPAPGEDRFDPREGHFTKGPAGHGHTLGPPLSMALASLLGMGFNDPEQRPGLPGPQRRDLLDHLLLYYRLHMEGLGELRSPAVLHHTLS